MDLTFSAEERAFEQEVRDFIAANLLGGHEARAVVDAFGVLRPGHRHRLAEIAA